MSEPGLAPLVALVGADGSGKSTLATDLAAEFARERPTKYVYLGLNSDVQKQKIAKLPLIGPLLAPMLEKKAGRTRDPQDKIPGPLTALVVYWFSLQRQKRFEAMIALRRRGVFVITDRYPQIEVPGFYDGPGLSAARAEGALVRRLAAREAAIYAEMVEHRPTLVIRLNIDADTALARKPDHARALVEQKIDVTPRLTFGGAPIAEVDASRPYDEVRAIVRRLIDGVLAQA